ncbi:MAG: PDZ domain-containing protein [Phycisphaerae bacterium]|nr:PDZ domain-containing protein [Phycisphaerae bacterium]
MIQWLLGLGLAWWLGVSGDVSSVSAAPTTAPAAAATRPAAVEQAARDLADPRWSVRRAAAETLSDGGAVSLPALRRAYEQTQRHEVRLRIRELAESVFSQQYTRQQGGFLGIRQRPRLQAMDPRVAVDAMWIEVLQVFRDTAADRAGLRPGDLIVRCDGQAFPADPSGQAFSAMVAKRAPGETVSIEWVRGQALPVVRTVRLGYRPLSVLAEADPEAYKRIVAAFDVWWQEWLASPAAPAELRSPTHSRPASQPSS